MLRILFIFCAFLVVTPAFATEITKDIAYGRDENQRLDVYRPDACTTAKQCPVVVWIHGGGWRHGSKDRDSANGLGNAWASQGIVMVNANYRLSPDVMHPAHIQDVAGAIAWVYRNIGQFGGDSSRLHLLGHSAGAHLVALVATDPKYLGAYGLEPARILRGVFPIDTASFTLDRNVDRLTQRLIKNAFGTDEQVLRDASPLYHAQAGGKFPPFIIAATSARENVVAQGQALATALQRAGTSAQVIVMDYDGDGALKAHGDIARDLVNFNSSMTQQLISYVLR